MKEAIYSEMLIITYYTALYHSPRDITTKGSIKPWGYNQ
jgi:hypothetical protein